MYYNYIVFIVWWLCVLLCFSNSIETKTKSKLPNKNAGVYVLFSIFHLSHTAHFMRAFDVVWFETNVVATNTHGNMIHSMHTHAMHRSNRKKTKNTCAFRHQFRTAGPKQHHCCAVHTAGTRSFRRGSDGHP